MSSTKESCRLSPVEWWLWDVDVSFIDCGTRLVLPHGRGRQSERRPEWRMGR